MKAIYDSKEIAEFCKTHTPQEAEAHFRCSRSTVSNACRAFDVIPMSRPSQKRQEMADWAKENEATIEMFCKRYKVSSKRALAIYKEFDLPVQYDKAPGRPISPTQFEVLALLFQGFRQCEIADSLNVSRQRVEQIQRMAEKFNLLGPTAVAQPVSKRDSES